MEGPPTELPEKEKGARKIGSFSRSAENHSDFFLFRPLEAQMIKVRSPREELCFLTEFYLLSRKKLKELFGKRKFKEK